MLIIRFWFIFYLAEILTTALLISCNSPNANLCGFMHSCIDACKRALKGANDFNSTLCLHIDIESRVINPSMES
jgi:epoxyqueuosine reductase QueG